MLNDYNQEMRTSQQSCENNEGHCDDAAYAQTVLDCSDVLRMRKDSGTDDSRKQVPGNMTGFREEGTRMNFNS